MRVLSAKPTSGPLLDAQTRRRHLAPPTVSVLVDRGLKSGKLDEATLTVDEAILLAEQLLTAARQVRQRT